MPESLQPPIIINRQGTELPKDGDCFVLGRNGLFARLKSSMFDRMVQVDRIRFLKEVDTSVKSKLPLIPIVIIGRAKMFFKHVFVKMRSESILLMFFNDATGEFNLECPMQTVAYTGISYDPSSTVFHSQKPGWQLVGSIHSHCDFGAHHSSTDRSDEINFNGLHITLGHVDREEFSCVSSFAFAKERFAVDPTTVIDGLNVMLNQMYNMRFTEVEVESLVGYADQIDEEWIPRVKNRQQRASSLLRRWWRGDVTLSEYVFNVPPTVQGVPVVEEPPAEPIYPMIVYQPLRTLEEILESYHVVDILEEVKLELANSQD